MRLRNVGELTEIFSHLPNIQIPSCSSAMRLPWLPSHASQGYRAEGSGTCLRTTFVRHHTSANPIRFASSASTSKTALFSAISTRSSPRFAPGRLLRLLYLSSTPRESTITRKCTFQVVSSYHGLCQAKYAY